MISRAAGSNGACNLGFAPQDPTWGEVVAFGPASKKIDSAARERIHGELSESTAEGHGNVVISVQTVKR
jgi:hypothetical protein